MGKLPLPPLRFPADPVDGQTPGILLCRGLDYQSGRRFWLAHTLLRGGNALQNIFEYPEDPIRFAAIGQNCPWTHCYAAYVLLSTGAIPTLETPRYAEFRDRVTPDGSHWLTPSVHAFFSGKFRDSAPQYSPDKMDYLDALMALEYANTENQYHPQNVSAALERRLSARGIRSVILWGDDSRAAWLFPLLVDTSIRVKYVVDTAFEGEGGAGVKAKLKRRCKYPIKNLLCKKDTILRLNRYDALPGADATIVMDYAHFHTIQTQLEGLPFGQILSLTELAD